VVSHAAEQGSPKDNKTAAAALVGVRTYQSVLVGATEWNSIAAESIKLSIGAITSDSAGPQSNGTHAKQHIVVRFTAFLRRPAPPAFTLWSIISK
jgi:hypothetical protein